MCAYVSVCRSQLRDLTFVFVFFFFNHVISLTSIIPLSTFFSFLQIFSTIPCSVQTLLGSPVPYFLLKSAFPYRVLSFGSLNYKPTKDFHKFVAFSFWVLKRNGFYYQSLRFVKMPKILHQFQSFSLLGWWVWTFVLFFSFSKLYSIITTKCFKLNYYFSAGFYD
jgi:hypothetical protein